MTWKAYVVASGAGLLATYLASAPTITPERTPASATGSITRPVQPADIQAEAERLHARVRQQTEYVEPSRNPFHFAARPTARRPARSAATSARDEEPAVIEPVPPAPPPPIRLSGIVTDGGEENRRRTAILITLQGIVSVHEGERVGAEYQVLRIEEEAVELVANDGTTRRLTLRP
jgi:hypothetical protein